MMAIHVLPAVSTILAIALGVQRSMAYQDVGLGLALDKSIAGNRENALSQVADFVQDRLFIYPSKTCSDHYEIKTKRIIRTEDSLSNDALFVDAVVSETYQDCLHVCCGHGKNECDTTVYIQSVAETDENCFLFRCWFDNEQRCLFSSHEGYSSSMMGGFENPRFSNYLPNADDTHPITRVDDDNSGSGNSDKKHDIPTLPKKGTTNRPITTKSQTSTPSDDVKTSYKETTNPPKKHVDEQICMSTQYKCPESRECIMKRLVCDDIVDCRDGSDENGCEQESQDPIRNHDQQIPFSHSVVTMAPPVLPQHNDGVQGNTNSKDSTLPPNPPPPTHHADSNPKAVPDDDGQSKEKEKVSAKDSSVSRIETGQVEIPTGALFPLIVGLILTMFLVMMVGCRLRYMNRRLRYGRMKTNAHDADYLINGMYL